MAGRFWMTMADLAPTPLAAPVERHSTVVPLPMLSAWFQSKDQFQENALYMPGAPAGQSNKPIFLNCMRKDCHIDNLMDIFPLH